MQATSRTQPSNTPGWSHILAGPVIWLTYFMTGYLILEAVCNAKPQGIERMPPTMLATIIIVLTLIAFAAAVYAAFTSYRTWLAVKRRDNTDVHEPALADSPATAAPLRARHDAGRFMALTGILLGTLFAFIILATGYPVLVLNPCW
jgi:DMSO reductase anchor subunit